MNNEQIEAFKGDDIYSINCTGDACKGDFVKFSRATFVGSYKKPRFNGYEIIEGQIISDSYGKDKQQHTFTILLNNGEKTMIKGRNLYRNECFRKPWEDENIRNINLNEKHERGDIARENRKERREKSFY